MTILDLLFPRRCIGCESFGRYFCDKCRSSIRTSELSEAICPVCEKPAIDGATHPRCKTRYCLDGLISFFRYNGIIRQATKAVKYRLVTDLVDEFIGLVSLRVFNNVTIQQFNNLVLVPIPLYPSRFRQRGFNQAEVLGRALSKKLRIPIRTDILRRVRKTTPQVDMKDRDERLKNVKNVFSVSPNILISQSLNIFLFDDVFTTGATMRSAALTLKHAGAKIVWGITMAR